MLRAGAFCAVLALTFSPMAAHAIFYDANVQCPPGGSVGQKCTDITNGYVTQGRCSHVYVCVAEDVSKNPPKPCLGPHCIPKPPAAPATTQLLYRDQTPGTSSPMQSSQSIDGILEGFASEYAEDEAPVRPAFSSPSNSPLESLIAIPISEEAQDANAGQPLRYSSLSFDRRTSALYSSLRDSGTALNPNQAEEYETLGRYTGTGYLGNATLHAKSTFMAPDPRTITLGELTITNRLLLESGVAFNFGTQFFGDVFRGIMMIFLLDFAGAFDYFLQAYFDFTELRYLVTQIIKLLFALIYQSIFGEPDTHWYSGVPDYVTPSF